ncbi:serine hydrolase [Bacillus litorisediminis]|uniref:serine hydrolase n=1 Tax=Bacillus litorisediminis TaxID=2922713 RepID=UPI001FAEC9B0|nr:serine hydrolase [Bacillus litorisediminis]
MNTVVLEEKIKAINDQFSGRFSAFIAIGDQKIKVNSDEIFLSASLIKIPILIAGYRQVEQKIIDPAEIIHVPKQEKVGGSGVIASFSDPVRVTVQDLMTLMITVSDNTATNMLIDLIGLDVIQSCIKDLGLKYTQLNRKLMDLESKEKGIENITCASDIACCLKTIHQASFLSHNSSQAILSIMAQQQFTHKLPAYIDAEKVKVYNKTGELDRAEHDCMIITAGEKTAYIAVLTDQLEHNETGRQAIRQIGKYVYECLMS